MISKNKKTLNWQSLIEMLYQQEQRNFTNSNYFSKFYDIESLQYFEKICFSLKKIDNIIQKALFNYSLNRLEEVDKAIVRISTFLLINQIEQGKKIINTALEITKKYDNSLKQEQRKFTNKLLDNIYHSLLKEKQK